MFANFRAQNQEFRSENMLIHLLTYFQIKKKLLNILTIYAESNGRLHEGSSNRGNDIK